MKKIIIFLSFLLLTNCGYQPIFSKKDANFLIEEIIFDQNDKISLKIKNNLRYLSSTKNYTKVIKIKLNSEKKIDISSKDSKGDPLIYKMLVSTNLEVYSNGIAINKKEIIKSFSYKNTTNKFDLKQYEITIENNLINSIKEDIILILYD
tara:strand:+ start:2583 stop:3032 length:450 start_codon:yes stop_codon:yes gene_type:complete